MAAHQSAVEVLEAARRRLWEVDRRRHAADDVVWQLLMSDRYPESEYLTANLEVAHAHMVGRDVAEQGVMEALDAPRPPKREAGEARRLLGELLDEYGWHRAALKRSVCLVRDRHEAANSAELARRARRASGAAMQPARIDAVVATSHGTRTGAR
jgi:hypothetical protein